MKHNTLIHKLVPLLLLTVLPVIAQALDYTCTTNNGAITITGYTGSGGDVSIPSTINGFPVTTIGYDAFSGVTSLTSVTIPISITTIDTYAFFSCHSLTAVTVDAGNVAYSSVDGVLFNKNQTTLIQYPGGKTGSYTFPSSVTSIGQQAFSYCANLTSVTIPDSFTSSIGGSMFSGCYCLTDVTVGSGVTHIKSYAFWYCTSLTNVIIRNGPTAIDDYAFQRCTSLAHITLPASITTIGHGALSFCANLNGVYFRGNAPSLVFRPPFLRLFDSSPNVTVYYLPGTTGWEAMYGERPTVLWQPRIETGDESFGVHSNQFGFNIVWASGQEIVVEANTSLTNSVWQPLQTNTLSSDSLYFSDEQWTNYPSRFYRISSP